MNNLRAIHQFIGSFKCIDSNHIIFQLNMTIQAQDIDKKRCYVFNLNISTIP